LLRRFRLRSLSYGGQVAPRNDEYNRLKKPWIGCGKPVDDYLESRCICRAGRKAKAVKTRICSRV
jgi:hypothetical protein